MPPLVTAGTPLGRVGADAGVPRLAGAVLTVAGHDHQAAVVGAGADGPGDELDSCGTAEALVRTIAPGLSPDRRRRPRRCGHHHRVARRRRPLVSARRHPGWARAATHPRPARQGQSRPARTGRRGHRAADARSRGNAFGELTSSVSRRRQSGPSLARRPGRGDRAGRRHPRRHERRRGTHRKLVVTGGWSRSAGFLAVKRRRFGDLTQTDVSEAGARGAALFAAKAAARAPTRRRCPT